MPVKNKVQLITYPDSLGGDLAALGAILDECFPSVFQGGIHLLPPYPSSGDRGFAPLTYARIEPRFGSWADVRALGERYDILLDLMVNHISRQSEWFRDFLEKGRASEWADLFITLDKIWPDGQPDEADLAKVYLRRPRPYSAFRVGPGAKEELLWTTFGLEDPSEQVDMDVRSPSFRRLIVDFFDRFRENGVTIVRLDAVGYVAKKRGTSCFFVEPEVFEFLEWMARLAAERGIELLPEVHATRDIQYRLAERGYWIYDFILPYLLLDALTRGTATGLKAYLAERPPRQFTMLDCHDGVPLKPDVEGLYESADARALMDLCRARGGDSSRVRSKEHQDPDGFDVHQILGSYYALLGSDDEAYLAARAIQFFVPGVPQVYYVGLLAGGNDAEAVARTGEPRALNRHDYSIDEVRAAARRDVVQRLVRLIRFRNGHPAFDGEFRMMESGASELALEWTKGEASCRLVVDFRRRTFEISEGTERSPVAI